MSSALPPSDSSSEVREGAPVREGEAAPRPAPVREEYPRGRDRGEFRGRGRDRDADRDGGRRGDRRGGRRPRRRVCAFCVDKITRIDYKEHARLREFISDRGKILKSRMTGTCARHQRALSQAIKRARQVALLPFVSE
jgi:small subunit ribosomal protein S18